MARTSVTIAGKQYPIARGRRGERRWQVTPVPSQQGDPGAQQMAEWRVDGPDFQSFEQIPLGATQGYLGRDYGDGTDGRWEGLDTLGPLLNSLTLSTHDTGTDTVANCAGLATIDAWSTTYAYIIRGTRPAKVDLSDMTLDDTDLSLPVAATDIIATVAERAATLSVISELVDATNFDYLNAGDVAITPDGLYAVVVAPNADTLSMVDISDPRNMSVTGTVTDATALAAASKVIVSRDGQKAYVANNATNRIAVIDISTPATPSVDGSVQDNTNLNGPEEMCESLDGATVFVACSVGDSLTAVTVSTPSTPVVAGQVIDATNLNGARGVDIALDGDHVYVAASNGTRLTVVDVTTPASPSVVGNLNDATNVNQPQSVVTLDSTYCAVGTDSGRITTVDISTVTAPVLGGSVELSGGDQLRQIAASADKKAVYAIDTAGDRVYAVDVSDRTSPTSITVLIDADALDGPTGLDYAPVGDFLITSNVNDDSITAVAVDSLEVSIGAGDKYPYQVVQRSGIGVGAAADTWAINGAGIALRKFGLAPDQVVGMAANVISSNILTGGVTMGAPAWTTVATITGRRDLLKLNGFALDGGLWVVATSNGPYILDEENAEFFPLIDEIDNNDLNGLQMQRWFALGVVIPLANGLRFQRDLGGATFGPTEFKANTSPVQGRPTAVAGSTRWLYTAEYNPVDDDTYLVAWRRWPDDYLRPANLPLAPHVIGKLPSNQACEFMSYVGTVNGLRTNETLIGGLDDDAFWMTVGRTAREIDDTNYRYVLAGTTYLTEARRHAGLIWDLEAVEFETSGVTANLTVQFGWQFEGGTERALTGSTTSGGKVINGVVNTGDGWQRQLFVDDNGDPLSTASGRRPKPRLIYASNVNTAAPSVIGTLRLFYTLRPVMTELFSFTVELTDDDPAETAQTLEEHILEQEREAGPVEIATDLDLDTYYVRIESVRVYEAEQTGSAPDSTRGSARLADVVAKRWWTAGDI